MTSGSHVIRCRDTGEALANKLDGGECVCAPGVCEMRKLRNREGDFKVARATEAKINSEGDGFDMMGFAIGLATGFPVSPRGITMGSIVGSLLHPTERHAAYDVTSDKPTIPADDTQPGTPAAPVRDVDFNDNSTSAQPIDPPAYSPDPAPQAAPAYEPPSYTPDPQPSYSPPAYEPPSAPASSPSYTPSYTPDPSPSYTPDPSPSYDSGSSSSSSSND